MARFLAENSVPLGILAICLMWFVGATAWNRWLYSSPYMSAISLSPPGKVESKVSISVGDDYELWLNFNRAGHSFEEMSSLIGHAAGESGIAVPIRWSITPEGQTTEGLIGEVESVGSNAWSAEHVGRLLGRPALASGNYLIQAAIARDVPQLRNLNAEMELSLNAKSGHSWQVRTSWLASTVTAFILPPTALVVSLWLLWKLFRFVA